jgi:hypothetical protein
MRAEKLLPTLGRINHAVYMPYEAYEAPTHLAQGVASLFSSPVRIFSASNALSLLEGRPIIGAAKATGTVALGETIAIGGINLGPLAPIVAPAGADAASATLGPTQVFFDGVPALVTATYFSQVRAIVPARVSGKIVVKYFDQVSFPREYRQGLNG